MKARHVYTYPLLVYIGLYALSGLLYPTLLNAAEWCYDYLNYRLPSLFPRFNPIEGGVGYTVLAAILASAAGLVLLLLVSYIAIRCDNRRQEYIISATDGRYTIPEGIAIYRGAFLRAEVLIAAIPPLFFTVPAAFIPQRFLNTGLGIPFRLGAELAEHIGIVGACLALIVISVAARIFASVIALSRWRAVWLAGGI